MRNKIVALETLEEMIKELHTKGRKVISTSGCFDIIHAGHIAYLEEAAGKGDVLVVLLNSDSSVRGIKGAGRPIVPQQERASVIAGLECVDYVCIFDEYTPCNAIAELQPDIFIKGGDYRGKHIPEMDVLSEYGGKVEYVSMVQGCSSTAIIDKIRGMR